MSEAMPQVKILQKQVQATFLRDSQMTDQVSVSALPANTCKMHSRRSAPLFCLKFVDGSFLRTIFFNSWIESLAHDVHEKAGPGLLPGGW